MPEAISTAQAVLQKAHVIIGGSRRDDYGDALASFTKIAALWSPVLGIDVTPQQAALCLVQLKVARAIASPDHVDSYVDMAGYASLGYQVVLDASQELQDESCDDETAPEGEYKGQAVSSPQDGLWLLGQETGGLGS